MASSEGAGGFGERDRRERARRGEDRRGEARDGAAPDAAASPAAPDADPPAVKKAPKKRAVAKVSAAEAKPAIGGVSVPDTSALGRGTGEPPRRLLLVEDNPKVAAAVAKALREREYRVDVVHLGYDGEEAIMAGGYDLVIMDVMLPDRDGMEVCRAVRRRRSRVPILILSALSATSDKVAGLEAGGDDYLAKPFDVEELVARIRALLRRPPGLAEQMLLRVADLELDAAARVCTRGGQTIQLTNREFAVLEYLVRNAGRVLSRTQIGDHVWDMNFDPTSNVIDVYVAMLRRKIDKGFGTPLLHVVIGAGYMLREGTPAPAAGAPG